MAGTGTVPTAKPARTVGIGPFTPRTPAIPGARAQPSSTAADIAGDSGAVPWQPLRPARAMCSGS